MRKEFRAWIWGAWILGIAGLVGASEPPPGAPSEEEWKRLQERVAELERKAGSPEKPQPTHKGKPIESLYDEGFWFVGPDDKLRVGGSAQFDARVYEQGNSGDNTFQVRRARLYATGTLEDKWGYMVMGRWDRGALNLHFAWVESQHSQAARLRIGQFKEPYSMEGVNADQYFDFNERSLWVANLLQLEDIGMMLYGKGFDQRVEYGIGVFNGRGKEKNDTNDDKELAGQMIVAPFAASDDAVWKKLYIAASGSYTNQENDLAGASYSTAAQTPFWTYAAKAYPNGPKNRESLELEWLWRGASLKGGGHRAVFNDLEINPATGKQSGNLTVDGWTLSASCLLTGEEKRRNKPVVPAASFDPTTGGWGAVELVGRAEAFYGEREFLKAGYFTGTNQVESYTLGANWYLNRHMKTFLGFQNAQFRDAIPSGTGTVMHENTTVARFQFDF